MTNAVTGLDPGIGKSAIPESLREMIREAARRSAPKVRQALQERKEGAVTRLPFKPRDS